MQAIPIPAIDGNAVANSDRAADGPDMRGSLLSVAHLFPRRQPAEPLL